MAISRPILVTGSHRSGSTWVGKTLAKARGVTYIEEPFNIGRNRRALCNATIPCWFYCVDKNNDADVLRAFQKMVSLRYGHFEALKYILSEKGLSKKKSTLLRAIKEEIEFARGRFSGQGRALIKDPIAIFSAEWIHSRLNADVVVLIRHPAAFVSSLARLGWSFDFRDLLEQEVLIDQYLSSYVGQIEKFAHNRKPVIEQGALLWTLIHYVINEYRTRHDDWVFARHEDLSTNPAAEFKNLYSRLGLDFDKDIENQIEEMTGSRNPVEAEKDAAHGLHLDSRKSIAGWKSRLSLDEIKLIRAMTGDVADLFYNEVSWQ
ncbi:MAG: sulfotransferase [Gammaproteobacteria bacterium]|nr:sulfotransferase [Gammaproteobacteria bacterium]MCK5091311.1 sulfotransferase [Gammaproteobacteria bacterium]